MTALDWSTTTEHTDVVCPPNPDAFCRHCGDTLEHHACKDDPESTATPDNAICIDPIALMERRAIRWNDFELVDGERLDCPDVGACGVCDVDICSEHSTEFTTCVTSSAVMHHLNCVHVCPDCADAARDDERNHS